MDSFTITYDDPSDPNPTHTLHCCIVRESTLTNVEAGDILVQLNGQTLIGQGAGTTSQAHEETVVQAIRTATAPRVVRFFKNTVEIDPTEAGATLSYNEAAMLLAQL
jgi:arginine deiminase